MNALRLKLIDRLLVCSLVAFFLLAVEVPISNTLLQPGFSAMAAFGQPFSIFFLAAITLCAIVWLKLGEDPRISLGVSLASSYLFLDLWVMKAPGGFLLSDGPYNWPISQSILTTGHDVLAGVGLYPAMFHIEAALQILSGLRASEALMILNLSRPLIYTVLLFPILKRFVPSTKLVSGAVIFATVADLQLFTDPPFHTSTYGFILFLVTVLLLYKAIEGTGSRSIFSVSIALFAAVITYPLVPFIILMILVALLLKVTFEKSKSRGTVQSLILVSLSGYLGWLTYISLGTPIFVQGVNYVLNLLFGPPNATATGPAVGNGGALSYLINLLTTNVYSLPYGIGYLIPIWFLVLFGGGGAIWIVGRLFGFQDFPDTFVVVPLVGVGGMLLLGFPGGAEWTRLLVYIGPFLAATWLIALSRFRRQKLQAVIVIAALVLALPTAVSYFSAVGYNGAHYSSQFSTGEYALARSSNSSNLYSLSTLVTVSYEFNNRINTGASTGPVSTAGAVGIVNATLEEFLASREALLTTNAVFFDSFSHLYGTNATSTSVDLVRHLTSLTDRAYDNGYDIIYSNYA